jgi:uncharacterized membrane protein
MCLMCISYLSFLYHNFIKKIVNRKYNEVDSFASDMLTRSYIVQLFCFFSISMAPGLLQQLMRPRYWHGPVKVQHTAVCVLKNYIGQHRRNSSWDLIIKKKIARHARAQATVESRAEACLVSMCSQLSPEISSAVT